MTAIAAADPLQDLGPEWDLRDLYAGPDDPRILGDLAAARADLEALFALKGRLEGAADPLVLAARLDQAISLYESATNRMGAIAAFAQLRAAALRDDAAAGAFEADVRSRISALSGLGVWLTLELNRLDPASLEAAFAARSATRRWAPWIRRQTAGRDHLLGEDLERLLIDRAPAAAQWPRLFDETLARLRVEAGQRTLTLSEALNRLSHPEGEERAAAAHGLSEALGRSAPVLGLCLNVVAQEKAVEDRWRRFASPVAARHLANEVDGEAVSAMEQAVVGAYPRLSHRYYALKARALGQVRLNFWDRNAPVDTAPPRPWSWTKARALVLDSFADLGGEFADLVRPVFDEGWIDARARPGKQSGAFCHPVTADRHPYVFMNFMGERRDVLTLAHEMGHALHQRLAAGLGTLNGDTPLTLAETASIFAENLAFDRLLSAASDRAERRGLIAGRIEDGLNTVVRQIAFHRFETRFHAERLEGEVPVGRIGDLFEATMQESLGPAFAPDPRFRPYWAYVSHFVHAPFYVYAYAFGDLLVAALMESRAADPRGFADRYRALLAAGGSRPYVQALEPFGLDPREPRFWATGLGRLERLIDQFEALV